MTTWYKTIPFGCLVLLTLLALWIFSGILINEAEAKIIGAALGGQALVFLAPFWILYRRRIPLLVTLPALPLFVWAIVLTNCWAASQGGTRYTHPSDYAGLWQQPIPGLLWVAIRTYIGRRAAKPITQEPA